MLQVRETVIRANRRGSSRIGRHAVLDIWLALEDPASLPCKLHTRSPDSDETADSDVNETRSLLMASTDHAEATLLLR